MTETPAAAKVSSCESNALISLEQDGASSAPCHVPSPSVHNERKYHAMRFESGQQARVNERDERGLAWEFVGVPGRGLGTHIEEDDSLFATHAELLESCPRKGVSRC